MQINLPSNISGTSMSPRSISYVNNYYDIGGVLAPRRGIREEGFYSNTGIIEEVNPIESRGLMVSADGTRMYAVVGNLLFRVYPKNTPQNGAFVSISLGVESMDGDLNYNVSYAVGFTGIAICTGETNFFLDTSNDTIAKIADPDLPAAISVSYIDGRFVYVAADGSSVYYSEVNDATDVSALSFFDAESRPDINVKSAVIGNDLYIFAAESVERFRNVGPATAPFVRVSNSILSIGYIGGMIELTDSVVFIGRRRGFGYGIFRLSGSTITEVSTPTINEMLNETGSSGIQPAAASLDSQLKTVKAQTFTEYGLEIVAFSFVRTTGLAVSALCIYAAVTPQGLNWGFLSDNPDNTYTRFDQWGLIGLNSSTGLGAAEADEINRGFSFVNSVSFGDRYYFQRDYSYAITGLYAQDLGSYDSATPFSETLSERVSYGARFSIPVADRKNIAINSVEVYFNKENFMNEPTAGSVIGDENDIVNLRVSRTGVGYGHQSITPNLANQDWSDKISVVFGTTPTNGRVLFAPSGGIVASDGHLSMIIETNSPTAFAIEGVVIK